MMTTRKSSPWQKAKALVALPMAALAVAAFANTEVNRMAEQVATESEAVMEKAQADMAGVAQQTTTVVADEEKPVTVKGIVVDKEGGSPIAGVSVGVLGAKISTVTDAQGRFQMENVPIGSWVVVIHQEKVGQNRNRAWKRQVTEGNASNLQISIDYSRPTAQTESDKDVFDVVEEMPIFPGGQVAMMQWLCSNVKYPEEAAKAKEAGRVIAQFVVEKDGSITEAHIVKSVSPSLDAEAIRLLNDMPKWTPGKQKGKPVRVKYTVPIAFQLN